MLEASGFDYRNRYPQKYLFKLAKKCELDKDVVKTGYRMMLDLYRTFAPLRQTSAAMAFACLELATRVMDKQQSNLRGKNAPRHGTWMVYRQEIMETMLDLLDLYTHFQKSSIIGPLYNIDRFINIRIALNQESEERKFTRHTVWKDQKQNGVKSIIKTPKTPITPASPSDVRKDGASPATLSPRSSGSGRRGIGARGQDGTVRFMLEGLQAKKEKAIVADYFKTEYEEYEVEVEEPIRNNAIDHRHRNDRDERNGRNERHDRDFKRPRR
jgi:CTD kinase subunit beta